jgi:autotransporter strand-loop-strand O-heptosyltransferase
MLDIELGNRYDQVDRGVWEPDSFQCHFVEGPYLNIAGGGDNVYHVTYSTPEDGEYFAMDQRTNTWSRPDKKYFREWTIEAKKDDVTVFKHTLDLKGKSVIISFGSKALGDTLAWIPYVEEFRKKHGCTVYCSTWFNNILDYPEINFIVPGDAVENIYGTYDLGCFDGQLTKNVNDWRLTPLQKVASDILGLDYEPIRAKLKFNPIVRKGNGKPPNPYVCFSEFSTMQGKFWNRPGAWQNVIDSLNAMGYDCMSVSAEPTNMKNVIVHNGQGIEQTVADVAGAEFYIGLNAGVTWVAYSLGIPAVMVTGVSEDWNDFPNPYRVAIDACRPGCFNDPSLPIDRGMDWCPRKREYICTHDITEEMVMNTIYKLREDLGHAPQKRKEQKSHKREHKGNDALRPSTKTGNRRRHVTSRNVSA